MAPAKLIVDVQLALGLTQAQLAELIGRERRTIQRWQDRGANILPSELRTLAAALDAVRPDLAAECRGLVSRLEAGAATPDVVSSILQAAASAMGTTPENVRPGIIAAFTQARNAAVDVRAVLAALVPEVGTAGGE